MSTSSLTWNDTRVEQLKRCFDAGLSCSQIAQEIGVTRNAVIGKLNRMGLSHPRNPAVAQARRDARPARTKLRTRWTAFTVVDQHAMLRDAFPPAPVEEIAIHNGRGRTFLELTQSQCHWPIDDPRAADFRYCGNEAAAGHSYCAGHARLAYRGMNRRSA